MLGLLFYINLFISIILDLLLIRNIVKWKKTTKNLEKEYVFKKISLYSLMTMIANIFMILTILRFENSPKFLNIYVFIHIIGIILTVIYIYISEDIIPTLNYLEYINKYNKEQGNECKIGKLKKVGKEKEIKTINEDEMLRRRKDLSRGQKD